MKIVRDYLLQKGLLRKAARKFSDLSAPGSGYIIPRYIGDSMYETHPESDEAVELSPEVVAAMAPESVIEGRTVTNEDVRDWFIRSANRYFEIRRKKAKEITPDDKDFTARREVVLDYIKLLSVRAARHRRLICCFRPDLTGTTTARKSTPWEPSIRPPPRESLKPGVHNFTEGEFVVVDKNSPKEIKRYATQVRIESLIKEKGFKIEDGHFIARSTCKYPVVKIKLASMNETLLKCLLKKDDSAVVLEAAKKILNEEQINAALKKRKKSISSSCIPTTNTAKETVVQSQKSPSFALASPVEQQSSINPASWPQQQPTSPCISAAQEIKKESTIEQPSAVKNEPHEQKPTSLPALSPSSYTPQALIKQEASEDHPSQVKVEPEEQVPLPPKEILMPSRKRQMKEKPSEDNPLKKPKTFNDN